MLREQIRRVLHEIGLGESAASAKVVAAVLTEMACTDLDSQLNEVDETALTDRVYFHVFSDPAVRKELDYRHPLDSFR